MARTLVLIGCVIFDGSQTLPDVCGSLDGILAAVEAAHARLDVMAG